MSVTRRRFIGGIAAAIAAATIPAGLIASSARSGSAAPLVGRLISERLPDRGFIWQHLLTLEIGNREFAWAELSECSTISRQQLVNIHDAVREKFGREMIIRNAA